MAVARAASSIDHAIRYSFPSGIVPPGLRMHEHCVKPILSARLSILEHMTSKKCLRSETFLMAELAVQSASPRRAELTLYWPLTLAADSPGMSEAAPKTSSLRLPGV